jgi:spore coat protein U-like protein
MASSVNKGLPPPLVALVLLLAAPAAPAATLCRIVTGAGVAFGSYDMLSPAPTDSQGTVTVQCERNGGPAGVSMIVRIDQGAHGSVQARRMLHTGGSGSLLTYGLYRDAARSGVWGSSDGIDTVGAAMNVPDRGSASLQLTIYGRMPPRQNGHIGTYSDAVQLTVLY